MDKRLARLEEEYRSLMDVSERSDLLHIEPIEGNPPKRYRISFKCRGIMLQPDSGKTCVTANHLMEIYLPSKYPNERPERRWLTPIFHPNINKNGGVCLGDDWAPSMTLAWLVEQLADYITYRAYNVDDPYNKEAADWARENSDKFPVDNRPLFKSEGSYSTVGQKEAATTEPVEVRLDTVKKPAKTRKMTLRKTGAKVPGKAAAKKPAKGRVPRRKPDVELGQAGK
jgi:ubiquitin-protein ligase